LDDDLRKIILKGKRAEHLLFRNFRLQRKQFRKYLPLFPKAIELLIYLNTTLIISSSHSVAKGVKTKRSTAYLLLPYAYEICLG